MKGSQASAGRMPVEDSRRSSVGLVLFDDKFWNTWHYVDNAEEAEVDCWAQIMSPRQML